MYKKLQSRWNCPRPSCLFPAPASLGQLIIRVYDVKTVGGNSNTLAFPRNSERARVSVKYQSDSAQVESVSNNDLIYACACSSFRERARECEKDKRENNKVRAGTG